MTHPYRATYVCSHCLARQAWRAKLSAFALETILPIFIACVTVAGVGAWFGYPLGHPELGAVGTMTLLGASLWVRRRRAQREADKA